MADEKLLLLLLAGLLLGLLERLLLLVVEVAQLLDLLLDLLAVLLVLDAELLEAVVVHGEEGVARDGVVHEDGDVALHPLREQPLTNLKKQDKYYNWVAFPFSCT